ncbi:hypothetical protein JCM17846_22810 [Iodidimonas nitroreducens]|uniref:DUF177 domain-containing protein n=1 Tax=Iodidimonas nitroreducens TaxID=1236968 RepID=A0A5A7NC20_9PROT|nr:DUF177 domain-containing protein [Iodidimonas nitroreducens]GAK33363.1 hypothetical protein AQ1_01251 [alpha proteobacterium Q-1]GER04599.1 hypothetical protein JCM17846_22810 [Iodidimonas nitroreducens]
MTVFHHIISRDSLDKEPLFLDLKADEAIREALSQRFELPAINALEGDVEINAIEGGMKLSGQLRADLVQQCVLTLQPIVVRLDEPFAIYYLADDLPEEDGEAIVDAEHEDVVALIDGKVDVGEALAQTLSLALDPFPRAEDAVLPQGVISEDELKISHRRDNPFSILEKLRDKT